MATAPTPKKPVTAQAMLDLTVKLMNGTIRTAVLLIIASTVLLVIGLIWDWSDTSIGVNIGIIIGSVFVGWRVALARLTYWSAEIKHKEEKRDAAAVATARAEEMVRILTGRHTPPSRRSVYNVRSTRVD